MQKQATGIGKVRVRRRLPLRAFLLGMSALCSATSAAAQDAGDQVTKLDEIVVTAQRRSENLQSVPIAISALTATQLDKAGVSALDNLGQSVPGLNMTRYAQATQPYIRGVGSQSLNVGQEGAVATYVDGVYIADSYALPFEFNSIDRIEILKGPQGTLYGRNATGGLINIITREPQAEPTLKATIGYGNYETFRGMAYVSGGNDKIAADLAVIFIEQNKGYGTWLLTGEDANYQRERGVRAKIKITPTDADTITLAADYYLNGGDQGSVRAPYPGSIQSGDGYISPAFSYDTPSGYVTRQQLSDNHSGGVSFTYVRDFGAFNMHFLSAYRLSERKQSLSGGFGRVPLVVVGFPPHLDSTQNEIYFSGHAGRLEWTTGVFIFRDNARFPLPISSRFVPTQNLLRNAEQSTDSYAAYAEGRYAITDETNLTVGVRITRDTHYKSGQLVAAAGHPLGAGTVIQTYPPVRFTESAPTWRLALDHHFSEDVMAYISYNRGFKSGTYNTTDPGAPPVSNETLDAYEVGFKSEFWDNRVRANAAAFYYKYKGIQVNSVAGPGITALFNAAAAEMKGVDASIDVVPPVAVGDLTASLGVAYLDANYTNFPNGPINQPRATGGNAVVLGDLSGNRMIKAPKWTINAAINYKIPVMGHELETSVSYYYNDGFFWEPDNRLHQSAYQVVNASAHVRFGKDDRYRIGIWGRNLTNEFWANYGSENGLGDGYSAGAPRTFGVTLDVEL